MSPSDLKAARAALTTAYLAHRNTTRYLVAHAKLIDSVMADLWRRCDFPKSMALVAVGGYGRQELFPHSDIDLLLLLPEGETAQADAKAALEAFFTAAWDLGLEIGHSVRTASECVDEAARDLTVATSLLEHRYLTGSKALYAEFVAARAKAFDAQAFARGKMAEQQQRHARFQDTGYSLEPNIKESPGGLRDWHMVRWLAQVAGVSPERNRISRALQTQGLIERSELTGVRRAIHTLHDLRIRLHLLSGRHEDRLVFDWQSPLAKSMGFVDTPAKRASEQLMQRYYRAAKVIIQANHVLLAVLHERIAPRALTPEPVDADFQRVGSALDVIDPALFQKKPLAVLKAFALLGQRAELKYFSPRVRRSLFAVSHSKGHDLWRMPEARALFLDILRAPVGIYHAIRAMNHYGLLSRILPPWHKIVGQMQHDLFHVYTVDAHIIMVLRNMRRFANKTHAHEYPLCSELIADFDAPEVLYLACLFHDIAKGRGGDHSTLGARDAERYCKQLGLGAADAALVAWLVRHHLTMSATAQKQDITDPEVVAKFTALVGDERRLIALYLMTVADIRGTSPKVWNAWKARLLESLFRSAQRTLRGAVGTTVFDTLAERLDEARKALAHYGIDAERATAFWSTLDSIYLQRHSADEIAWHARMLCLRVDSVKPVVCTRLMRDGEGLQLMVYVKDQAQLFRRITGVLGGLGWNILDARVHTSRQGYALDTFVLNHADYEKSAYRDVRQQLEHDLGEALASQPPLASEQSAGRISRQLKHFPLQPQVAIMSDDRGGHVLDIVAGDRPGLLARISEVLGQHNIIISSARINTLGARAEDVFLIQGESLTNESQRVRIESELAAALA